MTSSIDDQDSTVTLFSGAKVTARLVVDATGTGQFLDRPSHGPMASQVAYGQLLEVDGHPFRCGEMALMDFRPIDDGERPPTFLYALPLDYNLLFVEETSLIATVPVSRSMLERRLDTRLTRLGITNRRVISTEQVHIPMTRALPLRQQRMLGYGAAAAMVHPATGHHLARVLARAPEVAQSIAHQLGDAASLDDASRAVWKTIWPRDDMLKWELYNFRRSLPLQPRPGPHRTVLRRLLLAAVCRMGRLLLGDPHLDPARWGDVASLRPSGPLIALGPDAFERRLCRLGHPPAHRTGDVRT